MTREWFAERDARMALGKWRLEAVASYFGMRSSFIRGPVRSRRFVHARAVAARLMRHAGLSTTEIGKVLGRRDHTTAMNLLKISNDVRLRGVALSISLAHDWGYVGAVA